VDVRIGIPDEHIKPAVLNAGLEAVTKLNEGLIASGQAPTFAQAMAQGVKWKPEPPGLESFDHAGIVSARGWGDCDDLAPLHAASLRVSGQDPGAQAVVFKSGPHRWHAVVKHGDGSLSDPSQTAGMRVREGSEAAGIPPAVVGCMSGPCVSGADARPYVAVTRDARAYVGRADLPFGKNGRYAVSVIHRDVTPARALAAAMTGVAALVGCNPELASERHAVRLHALSGLLRGKSPVEVARVVGVKETKAAVQTLAELCPAILTELQAHRRAVENGGSRVAGSPFGGRSRGGWKPPHKRTGKRPAPPKPPGGGGGGDDDQGDDGGAADDNLAVAFDDAVGFSFGHLFSDIGKGVAQAAQVVKGAAGIIQGVVSLVPGIGTGISAAIGAGMALLDGGSPLEIAIHAAFGAIPIPPGARDLARIALDAVLALVKTRDVGEAAIAAVRAKIPSGLPQQVFDTLAHLVLSHIHGRATTAIVSHPPGQATQIHPLQTAAQFHALHAVAPTPIKPALVRPLPRPMPTREARPLILATQARVAIPHFRGAWVFA
jgi:hypothetical protein